MDALAGTSRVTAAERALESERPDALFRDPWAGALAGGDTLDSLRAFRAASGDNPYTAIRTRVFDDWLTSAVGGTAGLRQVVLLGAGMDTRAFRLDWREEVQFWELDRLEVLELKETILAQAGARPACLRRTVTLDLTADDLLHRLVDAGFNREVPTAWLAEGLLPYLRPEEVESLLAAVARLSARGSRLALDLVAEDFVRTRNAYLQSVAQHSGTPPGAPFQFGTNDPITWLARGGWRAEWVREPGDAGADFERWSAPQVPRESPGYPRFFFVAAVLAEDETTST